MCIMRDITGFFGGRGYLSPTIFNKKKVIKHTYSVNTWARAQHLRARAQTHTSVYF